jgi:WD40 repeat protein
MKRLLSNSICKLFVVYAMAGVALAEDPKPKDVGQGPWISTIATGSQPDQVLVGSSTSLLLRPSNLQRANVATPGTLENLCEIPVSIWKVIALADGNSAAVADYSGNLYVVAYADPANPKKLASGLRWIRAMIQLPDGRLLVGTEDGKIVPINLADGAVGAKVDAHTSQVFSLAVANDKLVSSGGEGTVKIWNLADMALVREVKVSDSPVWSAMLTADGQNLLTGGSDRRVNLYEANTGRLVMSLGVMSDWVSCMVALPDNVVAAGCMDGSVYLFDVPSKLRVTKLAGPGSGIWSLAVCQDAQHLIAGTRKHGLAVFSADQWQPALAETRAKAAREQPPMPPAK